MKNIRSNFYKANQLLEGNVSNYLDLIRGISAILVVMEHLSSRLLVGYGNVQHPNVMTKVLYLLNMLGSPAVIIFFVLSGLFISKSVITSIYEDKWSWKSYLINRCSRLYVVLIPALILTFVLDSITVNFTEYKGYHNTNANLEDFTGNLFFLVNIFVRYYGSNAPLWSLSYEFWYYMLFPIVLHLFFYRLKKTVKIIYLAFFFIIVATIGIRMNSYFLVWLIGTLALIMPSINFLKQKSIPIIAFFLLGVTMLIRPLVMTGRLFTHHETQNLLSIDIIIGITFGLLIYSFLHSLSDKTRNSEIKSLNKFSKLISSFSFSLYLIHYPIINTVYFFAAKNDFSGLQPNFIGVISEIIFVALICVVAYFFSRITESKTNIVRKFLFKIFSQRIQKPQTKQKVVG